MLRFFYPEIHSSFLEIHEKICNKMFWIGNLPPFKFGKKGVPKKDDVYDDVDDNCDADDVRLTTNEENEETWDNFPDVTPGKVCIPWKLLHLLGTRSERKTELCVSKHLKIFSFGGK